MTEIHGTCDDSFAAVRDTFAANFETRDEVGASVAVTVDGSPVVDLWGGDAGPGLGPWERDTIVNVYSTTKTMAALCVLMCADRDLLDLDAPVATYWPEFAANGKDGVLVRHVMSHASGVAGFDPPLEPADLYDWDAVCAQLAGQEPWWEPGTVSGYHALTQGFLQGEIVRRVTGRTIGTFFREEVAEPLGADFHIGLDPVHDDRVGEMIPPELLAAEAMPEELHGTVAERVLTSCNLDATEPRTRAWRAAEIPAAGGIGNARSVARVHAALACGGEVDGVRLLGPEMLDRALRPVISGTDVVFGGPMTFGMGYGLSSEAVPLPNDRTMYWGGWGGSVAFIDLENRMSIAYVMNRMASDLLGDSRGLDLVGAAYGALLTPG